MVCEMPMWWSFKHWLQITTELLTGGSRPFYTIFTIRHHQKSPFNIIRWVCAVLIVKVRWKKKKMLQPNRRLPGSFWDRLTLLDNSHNGQSTLQLDCYEISWSTNVANRRPNVPMGSDPHRYVGPHSWLSLMCVVAILKRRTSCGSYKARQVSFNHYGTKWLTFMPSNTAWCSEIGSLTSPAAWNSGASSDSRRTNFTAPVCMCQPTIN